MRFGCLELVDDNALCPPFTLVKIVHTFLVDFGHRLRVAKAYPRAFGQMSSTLLPRVLSRHPVTQARSHISVTADVYDVLEGHMRKYVYKFTVKSEETHRLVHVMRT
jgi:hypothetical protein